MWQSQWTGLPARLKLGSSPSPACRSDFYRVQFEICQAFHLDCKGWQVESHQLVVRLADESELLQVTKFCCLVGK